MVQFDQNSTKLEVKCQKVLDKPIITNDKLKRERERERERETEKEKKGERDTERKHKKL